MLRQQPQARVLAVNLPGHGGAPGDLAGLTIEACVSSVVAQVQAVGPERVVLVGHSMAGITLPGVAARLGEALVQHMVFVACCVPAQGQCVLDTLHQPMAWIGKRAARRSLVSPPLPRAVALWVFGNGLHRDQKRFLLSCLNAESTGVTLEPVDRSNLPPIARSWVIPGRDRAVNPALQRRFIQNLGGVGEVHEIDTCHDIMISEPDKLAAVLLRCA
jgi:pimeloyl-ACP methyl ester carboxylesterase